MNKKVQGIILLVLAAMAIFGSIVNGSFAEYANGVGVVEITTIVLEIAIVVGGIVMIIKGKK